MSRHRLAPIAQLDRALPSEGRGQRFESSWVRHFSLHIRPGVPGSRLSQLQIMKSIALLDPAANDSQVPALIIANEGLGWRIAR